MGGGDAVGECGRLAVTAVLSSAGIVADAGNGFLGIALLTLSLLDRGETAFAGCCGAASSPSRGESRWT
jgi:hypothetical protein